MVSRFYPFSASGFVKQGANKLMLDVHVLHELSIYSLVSKQEPTAVSGAQDEVGQRCAEQREDDVEDHQQSHPDEGFADRLARQN